MKLTSICTIRYRDGDERIVIEPGTVFTPHTKEAGGEYVTLGAARAPTETELALAAMADRAKPAEPAKTAEPDKASAADAAKAAEPAKTAEPGVEKKPAGRKDDNLI